jgi:hypothetical protein
MPFFTEDIKQGVKSFTDLNDTPASLVAGQTIRANATGTALEFYVPSGGGGGSSIDDSSVSTTTTYSSSKIVTELGTKANTTALNSYLPLAGGSLTGDVTTNVPNGSFTSTSLVTRNYVDNAVGGSAGSTTYTGLTDTPASHSANALLYSTGSAIAHTTTQIAIDGNGVEVNQLNARVDGTSNIGDTSHKFNNVFCGNIHQGNVKLVIPSTRGSTGQYVKVGNANAEVHTLEFADVLNDAAASSSTTYSSSKINTDLGGKVDKTSIQTLAEGDSTSESDVYSCNAVYSKNQINTSVNTQAITLNNTSSAGLLNFGSNQVTGNYANLQTYANGTRYSSQQWSATGGNANVDWYFMKDNSLTRTMAIRPNDRNEALNVLTGGIKGETLSMRDGFITARIGNYGSVSAGRYGLVITPLVNTINSEIELRGLRSTGILSDFYTNHLSGSTLTLQSRLATNRHSTTHSNIEVTTYQNGASVKVLDIGASSSSAKTLTITGTTHSTGHVTTDQTTFSNNNELVTKQFVDTSIANLVNSAPATLDTLNELAAALGNDPNFATTVTNNIATKLPLSGGAMTGQITTNQTVFSNNNELVTKQYVDAQIVAAGSVSQFTQLTDTPSSYTANRFLKSTGSGLDWFDLTSKTLTWDFYNALGDLPSASGNHGQIAHVHAEGAVYYAHNGSWVKLANDSDLPNIQTSYQPSPTAGMVYAASLLNNHIVPMAAIPAQNNYLLASNGGVFTWTNVIQSAYQASPAATMVYDCAYLNPRVLPTISSGTNQYVLGNDGTSASWLSTLQVGTNTINIGTSTLKKFASWFSGTYLEYFMKGTPSNGDTLGSVAFSDTTLNNYATFSGKVDDNSTRAGHFSFSTAKSGTITEQLIVGKSDHSNADAGQFAGTLKVAGVKFSGNTTQTKPVEDPATAGHVLTAGAGGTWSWAAPSGGGSSATQVDPLTFGLSGGANTTFNGVTQTPDQHRAGITIGDRRFKWFVDDQFFGKSSLSKESANNVINGYRRINFPSGSSALGSAGYVFEGNGDNEDVFEENIIEGGHITFTPNNGVHYKFRGIRLNADSYSTDFTILSPAGVGLYNSCVANGNDCRLAAFGLKNGVWKWLGTVSLNNNGAPNGGTISTPKDDTSMAEDPLTPSTTLRSEQMNFGSVASPALGITGLGTSPEVNGSLGDTGMRDWGTANPIWPGYQPTPLSGVLRGQSTVYSGTYLWKFTHNIDFYQAYRIQHVKTGLRHTVNSVNYQKFNDGRPQGGMSEVEFWAGVGT